MTTSTTARRTPAVVAPKRAARLVTAIEDRIEREQLALGTLLGTETQLMAQYGVSRETLRKAVRELEGHGVATMRRGGGGGGGGLIVAAPASQTAIRAIAAHLEFSSIGWAEIVEARALIDIRAAELASRCNDPAVIARLRQLSTELDKGPHDVHDIARRHLSLPSAIAESVGNPVVQLFTQSLNQWTVDILPSELGSPELRDREMRRVNDILRALVEAIASGDTPGARQAAEAFAQRSLKVSGLLEDRRQRASIDEWLSTASGYSDSKLAQRIALVMARDVAARGWPLERLGDEAGLIQRFGISRAVLREAIRLLELHGILRPQRGRGGGLMIGRPNPEHTIASAKRYLRRARLQPADYLTVRDTLESGAIHLAVTRADNAGMESLQQMGAQVGAADDSQITALAIEWHGQLSRLGRNRALSLLLRILFALTEEPQARLPADIANTLRDRHLRLTRTLVARDEAGAQKVSQEHISWLRHVLDIGLGSLAPQEEENSAAAEEAL